MNNYMNMYYGGAYGLVILGLIISLAASANCKLTFSKFKKIKSARGINAEVVARSILDNAGIHSSIVQCAGDMSDHYSSAEDTVYLSETVYGSNSIAAIGVAAHECGHAIQHHTGYAPVNLRQTVIPVADIASKVSYIIIFLGLVFGWTNLIGFGAVVFIIVVAAQLITLPVEFNASRRAMAILRDGNILEGDELKGAGKVLTAAALTYVAALVTSVLQLIRLLSLSKRK